MMTPIDVLNGTLLMLLALAVVHWRSYSYFELWLTACFVSLGILLLHYTGIHTAPGSGRAIVVGTIGFACLALEVAGLGTYYDDLEEK